MFVWRTCVNSNTILACKGILYAALMYYLISKINLFLVYNAKLGSRTNTFCVINNNIFDIIVVLIVATCIRSLTRCVKFYFHNAVGI